MSQFRGNAGTLIIVVNRGKDLPNKRKMEKQNPYCLLRISNLTDRTKADVRGGQTPRWDEEFRFNMSPEIQPILKLSVLDETKKAPVLIAEAEIDFTPVFYSSVKDGYDRWFPLTSNNREAGMVYLEMTFYPSTINATQSPKKSLASSSPVKKTRILPPIPGQTVEETDHNPNGNGIPAPLPRNPQSLHNSSRSLATHVSQGGFYHSDSFRPVPNQDFSRSTMSIHSLPDVPSHNNISKDLPTVLTHHQAPQHHIQYHKPVQVCHELSVSYSQDHTIPQPPSHPTRQLPKTYEMKTNSRNLTLESSRGERIQSVSTSNDFDELERQVQSDWARNNQRGDKSDKRPPPLPSHSSLNVSGNSNSSSKSLPPPLPHHTQGSVGQSSVYDVIEPLRSSRSGSRSPTRKPPTGSYSSSLEKLDSSYLPFDASTIGVKTTDDQRFNVHDHNILNARGRSPGDDELAEAHHAPTPYEAFVGQNTFGTSTTSAKSSPTRFNSSLPPLPPPR